jgi:hypothetical protein
LAFNPITSIEDLSLLLGLEHLNHLTVDPSLFSRYANEFMAWDALPGKTLRMTPEVPEPTAACLFLVGMGILSGSVLRPQRRTSVASRMQD